MVKVIARFRVKPFFFWVMLSSLWYIFGPPTYSSAQQETGNPSQKDEREHPELWPLQPFPFGSEDWIISGPSDTLAGQDPLVEVTQDPAFKGRVFYLPYTPEGRYLAFRGVNESGQFIEDGKPKFSAAVFYQHTSLSRLFLPRFSPDGKSVGFFQGILGADNYLNTAFDWQLKERTFTGSLVSRFNKVKTSLDSTLTAYIREGGEISPNSTPSELWIEGGKVGGSCKVSQDEPRLDRQDYSVTNFCWTPSATLLYVKFPREDRPSFQVSGVYNPPYHPSIYEAIPRGNKPLQPGQTAVQKVKVVSNGYAPKPSPDGKWIAYDGWLEKSSVQTKSGEQSRRVSPPSALLLDRRNSKVYVLRSKIPDQLIWSKDSKQIAILDHRSTLSKIPGQYLACDGTVSLLTVGDGVLMDKAKQDPRPFRPVATLHAAQALDDGIGGGKIFSLRGFSNDGAWIFVDKKEKKGANGLSSYPYNMNAAMVAVNASDGRTVDVLKFDVRKSSIESWDWYDDSKVEMK